LDAVGREAPASFGSWTRRRSHPSGANDFVKVERK
jgi:hypothetical protein